MARIAQNKLSITTLPGQPGKPARFFLSGYINGEQIRQRSTDYAALETVKTNLETAARARVIAALTAEKVHSTWLTQEQLRDAEAAFNMLKGKRYSLQQCVEVAPRLIGDGEDQLVAEAAAIWKKQQVEEHIAHSSIKANQGIVRRFQSLTKVQRVGDITKEHVRAYIFSGHDIKAGTHLTRTTHLKAFLNFCVEQKWLAWLPWDIDTGKLRETTGRLLRERDRILKPAQCEALLNAAASWHDGLLVPYTILSLWCFIRHEDVVRLTPEMIHLDRKRPVVEVRARKWGTEDYLVDIPANVLPILRACLKDGFRPQQKGRKRTLPRTAGGVPFARHGWDVVRHRAGLLTMVPIKTDKRALNYRGGFNSKIIESVWQPNLLRHTGESYHYQISGDIARTAKQAGHSTKTAVRHYLQLPKEGDAEKFYGITLPVFGNKIGAVA